MRIAEGGAREVSRGLVEDRRRQQLAKALVGAAGPLTTVELAKATERPLTTVRYHLRALSHVRAVTPSLEDRAGKRTVVWSLTADNLPTWAREVLLSEISLQTFVRLQYLLVVEKITDASELADQVGLSLDELARYVKGLKFDSEVWGRRLPHTGLPPERISDLHLPEWLARKLKRREEGEGPGGA